MLVNACFWNEHSTTNVCDGFTHAVQFKVKGQGGHLLRQLIVSFDHEQR